MNLLHRLFNRKHRDHAPAPITVENKLGVDVKPADSGLIKFVKMEYRAAGGGERYTYKVYRAETRAQAEEFLKGQVVRQELYYVEVETPEGILGRDIEGMYKV